MLYWLMETTGSSAIMGTILAVSLIPSVLLGPFGGVFADRHSRKTIIVVTDIIRGLSVFLLALLMFSTHDDTALIIWMFFVVSTLNAASKAFFQPAIEAFMPILADAEKLPKTIAYFGSSNQVATLVGQALGGMCYRLFGAPLLLLFDALSYLISAISEMFIQSPAVKKTYISLPVKETYKSLINDLQEGLDYVFKNRGLMTVILCASSINFFCAPIMLFLPFLVKNSLHEAAHWYGFMLAAMALGSMSGYWYSQHRKVKAAARAKFMFLSLLGASVCFVVLGSSSSTYISLTAIALSGFFFGTFNLQSMALFQSVIPEAIRGRVLSLLITASTALLPLGLVLSGIIGEISGNNTLLIYTSSGIAMGLVALVLVVDSYSSAFLATENL